MAFKWSNIMAYITRGVSAFQEAYVTLSTLEDDEPDEFTARRFRIEMARAAWENTRYRNIHKGWAQGLRNKYALYKYVRSLHDVTFQDTEFWVSVIYRGLIKDNLIGGAVPLVVNEGTDEEAARASAYQLLDVSNWNAQKNIYVRSGALAGYVGLVVVDDQEREEMRLEVVPPENIYDVTLEHGIVKGYMLVYWKEDASDMTHKYTQVVSRGDNDDVTFETFTDDRPDAWTENTDATGAPRSYWTEPYGMIPFVLAKQIDNGGKWGVAELQPLLSKILESDDLGSMVDDQIRKMVNPTALLAGVTKRDIETTTKDATADKPQPGREETKVIYSENAAATWQPMVFSLDIAQSRERINDIVSAMKREYPELDNIWESGADASGKALRVRREPVIAKAIDRRSNYDTALLSAIRMGLAIGGWRGYDGYEGFDLTSYSAGKLGISIDERDIFLKDPADELAEKNGFWTTWAAVANSGVDFVTFAREYGWSEEKLAAYEAERQKGFIPAEGM